MDGSLELVPGLVHLAQVLVQAHPLHLQLLLDALHLVVVGVLHQDAGQVALGSLGQHGDDLFRARLRAVVRLRAASWSWIWARYSSMVSTLPAFLAKSLLRAGQLADADVVDLDLEGGFLAGQILGVISGGEGDLHVKLVPGLVAQDALLKAGNHPAPAQLDGLVLGAAVWGKVRRSGSRCSPTWTVLPLTAGPLWGTSSAKAGPAVLDEAVHFLVGGGGDGGGDFKAGGLFQLQLGLEGDGGGGPQSLPPS